jgi:hypothetical protein
VLHGVVGGLSGAVLGDAKSGALSAMIAETLADLVTPQVRDIAEQTAKNVSDEAAFDQAMNDYLRDQKNVILLTTTAVVAGFGGDVNVSIQSAQNALDNNAGRLFQAIVQGVKAAGQFGKGVWKKGPVVRGEIIEKKLGQNLHQNFPTVDKFKDGIVTSIKSVDLKAQTYQNTTKLRHTLTKYVDKVAKFNGGEVNELNKIVYKQIKGRALDIAIPKGASAAQKQIMKEIVDYGLTKDVMVNIVKIK